jgi:thiol:disulfide interchange protein
LPPIALFFLADLSRRRRREVVAHVAAYAIGIQLAMGALAAAVVALRAAGAAVGWGFQLQEPVFVAAVASLLVVFAANLFGAFEVALDASRLGGLGARAAGPARSFFDGLLAVVLATPCSAPFLGTAVGFAVASPPVTVLAIFAAIGVGLAAPFAAAALLPGRRLLPRPGPWMLELRRALAFTLLGAAAWLAWVAGRQLGVDGMARLLALLVVAGAGCWAFGRFQQAGRALPARGFAVALVALLALGLWLVDPGARAEPVAAAPWSPEAVRAELDRGRAAFVYFTADWCLTCQVNERRVLDDERVRDELERLDVAVFRADWTRRDESIRVALAGMGRAGVPAYALYAPDRPDRPVLLPELLSVDRLVEGLRDATRNAPREATREARPAPPPTELHTANR